MFGYRVRDVSRLLGLAQGEVRRLAREGLVPARRGARGEWRFSFQELVLLRAAAALSEARVPPARVRRALRALRRQLPAGRPLAGLRIAADGNEVVARDGKAAWRPDSGQLLIDFEGFEVREVAHRVAPLLVRGDGPARGAEEYYQWGCDLEAGAPEEARLAYRKALALDPGHAGACLNLGRLLHEAGDAAAAEPLYRKAREAGDPQGLAAFNLAVALEDLGRRGEALTTYREALAADPALADAHFNAARLLEAAGRRVEALRHMSAYRRLSAGQR